MTAPISKEALKVQVIKTTDGGCFLTDNLSGSNYYTSRLLNLIFDEVNQVKETFNKGWYFLDRFPEKVQIPCNGEITNRRYELLDRFKGAKNLPSVIAYSDRDKYLDLDEDYLEVYEYKYDQGDEYLADFPIEWEVLCVISDYKESPLFNYDAYTSRNFDRRVYQVTNADIKHSVIDKMLLPAPLLGSQPCSLSSEAMYGIVRQYVRENIDKSVALISSDYDFCFEVQKIVQLVEPVTVNYQNIFARTKKERAKWRTEIHKSKKVKIFAMTNSKDNYKGYPVIEALVAANEWELKEKLDTFLAELMKKINEPLEQCECCKGTGYKDAELVKKSF